MVPTLIGMTAVVFAFSALSPGGIGGALLSADMQLRPAERKAREAYLKARYDLDKPLPYQYFKWLNKVSPIGVKDRGAGFPASSRFGLKWPDLGESFSRQRPVAELIGEALPVSLILESCSLPLVYLIAIGTGIRAARKRGTLTDVGLGFVLLGLFSLPDIWVGVMCIALLTSNNKLQWFPSNGLHDLLADSMPFFPTWGPDGFHRGYLLDTAWHLVLPLWCISYSGFAFLSRLTRGSLLETLGLDFVRTARAKGLNERVVIFRHAVRNSLISLITASSGLLAGLVGGAVVVETIFGIPGMGKLAVDAANARDRELLLSLTLIASVLLLAGYLLADLAYAVADPRVSYVD